MALIGTKVKRSTFGSSKSMLRVSVLVRFDSKQFISWTKRMGKDPERMKRYAFYLRKVAKRSIRKTTAKKYSKAWKKPSRPGKPPRSRAPGHPLRNKMEAAFSMEDLGFVVGPEIFPPSKTNPRVPGIHEEGKTTVVTVKKQRRRSGRKARSSAQAKAFVRKMAKNREFRRDYAQKQQYEISSRTVTFPKRPFMVPAMQKTKAKFPGMWAKGANLT